MLSLAVCWTVNERVRKVSIGDLIMGYSTCFMVMYWKEGYAANASAAGI